MLLSVGSCDILVVCYQGSLVLESHSKGTILPPTYYASVIASVPLAVIELLMVMVLFIRHPAIANRAEKHIVNQDNVELDSEGNPIKTGATLRRLMTLAKPV